jgi:hypothetical protein
MILRIVVQILFIGIMWGYGAYKQEHKIEDISEQASIWFWLIMGLVFPLAFMWYMFLDALKNKG